MAGHATTPPTAKKPRVIKQRLGRPSGYSQKLANEICGQLSEGYSLRKILKEDNMPSMATVFNWLSVHEQFLEQYTRAKNETADALAEDIQDIADRTLKGEYDPNAARVAIDAYKWTAAKLKPKKYGEKLDHTSGGKELPAPILNIMVSPNTTNDNKREFIDAEVPEKTALDQPAQNSNIMDELNG